MVQALFSKRKLFFDFRQQEPIRGKIYRQKLVANNYSERRPICNANHSTATLLPRPPPPPQKNASIREKKKCALSFKNTKIKKLTTEYQGKRVTG